jgi:hypothetical protein
MKGEKEIQKENEIVGTRESVLDRFLVPQHNEIISCAMWFISIPDRARKTKGVTCTPRTCNKTEFNSGDTHLSR